MNTFQILLASNSNAAEHMAEAMERLVTIFPSDIRFSEVLESRAVNKAGESLINGGGSPHEDFVTGHRNEGTSRSRVVVDEHIDGHGRVQDGSADGVGIQHFAAVGVHVEQNGIVIG